MRFTPLFLVLGLLAADGRGAGVAVPPAPGVRPNVVFIFADDWGWGDLSVHGHPWLKTPRIDSLARDGMSFEQFNVLNPVCSPSRTAALTGHYPARYSVHQHFATGINAERGMPDWLDPRAPTIAKFFRAAGYRTGHFGKWHLTNRGVRDAPPVSAYGFDESAVFNGPDVGVPTHVTAENAVKFIRANKDRPFYLNVWIHESHTPHTPTKASLEHWKHLDEQKQVYSAVITDGDNSAGEVLDALKENGLEANTIVLFSSDNGPEITGRPAMKKMGAGWGTWASIGQTSGLRGRKRSLYEGGVRVPFLVRWPGHIPAGVKNQQTVATTLDLLPTLCAAAGVPVPADYRPDGENLLPALLGKSIERQKPVFWDWRGAAMEPDWWPRLAVREGNWKLYLTLDDGRIELHQLATDRTETRNVAAEHADVVERLRALAFAWRATLPNKPDPACVSKFPQTNPTRTGGKAPRRDE